MARLPIYQGIMVVVRWRSRKTSPYIVIPSPRNDPEVVGPGAHSKAPLLACCFQRFPGTRLTIARMGKLIYICVYIYVYIYVCIYICVCVIKQKQKRTVDGRRKSRFWSTLVVQYIHHPIIPFSQISAASEKRVHTLQQISLHTHR